MTLPIDGSYDADISISRFKSFVMENDLMEILSEGSQRLWNHNSASAAVSNDPHVGKLQFYQEAEGELGLFDLF